MFKFLFLGLFIVSSTMSALAFPLSPALEADMSSLVDRSKEFEGAVANLTPGKPTPVQMHAVQSQGAALNKALETAKQHIKAAGTLSNADNLVVQKGFTDMKLHVVSAMKQMEPFARGEALEKLRENTARLEGIDLPIDPMPNLVELLIAVRNSFDDLPGLGLGGLIPIP
ncbi:hypothetical protein ONZ45_g1502 [Pleurotus djamor]|nr:hypothetical protein ONZ45_g1502 [Pleurotus djamor]